MFDLATLDLSTVSLAEYLAMFNANCAEWVAAGPNRWSSGLTDDLAHWAEYGITTAEQLGAYLDAECAKEARKAAYDDMYTTTADREYFESLRRDEFFADMACEYEIQERLAVYLYGDLCAYMAERANDILGAEPVVTHYIPKHLNDGGF